MEFILSAFADEAGKMLDEQIAACRENGIDHIEMRGVDGQNVTELTNAQAREVAKRLDFEGFKLSALGSPLGKIDITDDFEDHLELFKRTAELNNILSTPNIRLFSFFIPQGKSPDSYKEAVFDRLSRFVTAAKEAGVRCCHENEKGIYGDTARRVLNILEHFKGEISGIFDFANFVQCGQDTLEAYDMLENHITYLHIKDAKTDDSVVPAGEGNGHIKEILSKFAMKKGRCFLTLEPHLTVFDGFDKLEQNGESLSHPFTYGTGREAFTVAAQSLRGILKDMGYNEEVTSVGRIWKSI